MDGNHMTTVLKPTAREFLGHAVAEAMAGYEPREPQLKMLDACADIIDAGGTLLAEAGTGTGKTFAYLVPIVLSGQKAVVSTRTLNLQEQLASKDLKLLSSLKDFSYAVAKGRSNYVCLRRLHAFHPDTTDELTEQKDLIEWVSETDSGDIEDHRVRKRPAVWEKVCSDSDACRGNKCTY